MIHEVVQQEGIFLRGLFSGLGGMAHLMEPVHARAAASQKDDEQGDEDEIEFLCVVGVEEVQGREMRAQPEREAHRAEAGAQDIPPLPFRLRSQSGDGYEKVDRQQAVAKAHPHQ